MNVSAPIRVPNLHLSGVDGPVLRRKVVKVVDSYSGWLSTSLIPKLFINADPAGFLIGAQREFCRAWLNQQEVTVKGAHFLQEDSPDEVGDAIARFVAKVLAGQIRRDFNACTESV